MRRSVAAFGNREQGNNQCSSDTTDDYHAHVTRMERMLSEADYPPFSNLHSIFKNQNGLLVLETSTNHDHELGNKNHNKQEQKGLLQWQTHASDDYHAHVTRMLRTPSIADDQNGMNKLVEADDDDREQNQNSQLLTHSTDEYHAYVTKMLRTPSIAYTN